MESLLTGTCKCFLLSPLLLLGVHGNGVTRRQALNLYVEINFDQVRGNGVSDTLHLSVGIVSAGGVTPTLTGRSGRSRRRGVSIYHVPLSSNIYFSGCCFFSSCSLEILSLQGGDTSASVQSSAGGKPLALMRTDMQLSTD